MNHPETSIREYRPEDRDGLVEVFVRAIRESAIRDYTRAQTDAWAQIDRTNAWTSIGDSLVWVAVAGDMIIGFIDLKPSGHLDHLYVHPEHERRGVASALLARLEDTARRQRLKRLFTEASLTAKPFFERHGFEALTAQVVEFRGERFTNFQMEKHLV